ncbi:MAG TPA: ABC transporter permease [Puia sp.]|nr:ABC transporter permease [Puia sp.]
MFRNYMRTAFRNLLNNKSSSVINILGLTIGITSCILIGMYIRNELNFDQFQMNGDRIFRVIMEYSFDGSPASKKGNFTSMKVAPVLRRKFPEVKEAVRVDKSSTVVRYGEKMLNEQNFFRTDSSFFRIFSFPLLKGNPLTVLNSPHQIVLTKSAALRYFGKENPIGKTLTVDDEEGQYVVTGLAEDSPPNSQIRFDFLASFTSGDLKNEEETYWNANYTTYLLLRDPKLVGRLEKNVNEFMKTEMAGQGATINYSFEPFRKIHLYSEYGGFEPNNNIRYIYILEGISVLLLVIASFTYINLNTARSVERAREVGVRKVVGAGRNQLFWQFMGESFILCLLAVLISLLAAMMLLPYFNHLTGGELHVAELFSIQIISGAAVLSILVSLMAGSYPAILLTKIIPVKVLKGSFKNTSGGQGLRRFLIIFQFSISIVLIVSTFITHKQLKYVQSRNLGFNREQVLVLPFDNTMFDLLPSIRQSLLSNPHIMALSRTANTPVNIKSGFSMRSSVMPVGKEISVAGNRIDENFLPVLGMQLTAGENLTLQDIKDVEISADSNRVYHFILNESAARQLGWTPDQAVGKKMYLGDQRPGYVRGVVKDFNFESMHQTMKPIVLFPENRPGLLLVKLAGSDIPRTISFIESKWKEFIKSRPFEYRFLDQDFNKLYESEIRFGKVLDVFSGLSIAMACLGLVGLSSYSAKQRKKEIGVRKVLGAGISQIASLLTLDILKPISIAILVSTPIAWMMMNRWLQDFAYHISISGWIFIMAGLIVIFIAMISVSFQVIRAAIANPVNSLRSE